VKNSKILRHMALVIGFAFPASAGTSAALSDRVNGYIEPLVASRDFFGGILISQRGQTVVDRSYGMANAELAVPARTTTRYAIGSVSKSITAAAILILRRDGKLSLSDPVGRFIAGLPYGDRVTIEQLLTHAAGVPDYYLFPEYFAKRSQPISLGELAALLAKKPLDFEPGSKSNYSNSGYALLADVIEKAAGQRYAVFLRSRIFEPLGMADSGDLAASGLVENLATGYDPGFGPFRLQRPVSVDPSWLVGSGSLYSTTSDLRRFAEANRSGKLVALDREPYPYGWGKRKDEERIFWEQNGRIPLGFVSYLALYPSEDMVVVVLGNVQVELAERIGHDLAAMAAGKSPDLPARPAAASAAPKDFERLAGRYEVAPGFALSVRADGDRLLLAGPEGDFLPLIPESTTRFFYPSLRVEVTFTLDQQGKATALSWAGQFLAKRIGD
jgi:CubicO group peptidase (beta-lactamase class C family)